jgi:hypothetical protein
MYELFQNYKKKCLFIILALPAQPLLSGDFLTLSMTCAYEHIFLNAEHGNRYLYWGRIGTPSDKLHLYFSLKNK